MPHTHFEDFEVGQEMEYGKTTMTAEEIIRFGKAFDPEPFHLGQEAARDTMFGELIASGIHMAAILRRMQVDGFANLHSQGSPEWERLQFLAPTRPGDVIHVRSKVLQTRPSSSRPALGIVRMQHELVDQNGQVKTRVHTTIFYKRRGDPAPPATSHSPRRPEQATRPS
ncbi:MAG: MaoC/PaaZ C-terminal domain-containing protein [Rhodospirillaceae bacterium]|nr:MaoC/PaaZ C-terminal domain-containing protein [Rhodospirillaceae bacterium]